jgi:soluble lytic murein transglycosylase-like protein
MARIGWRSKLRLTLFLLLWATSVAELPAPLSHTSVRPDSWVHRYLSSKDGLEGVDIHQLSAQVEAASYRGIDPLLVLAVIEVESNFNPDAESPTGAGGLMQFVRSTWEWMADRMDADVDRFDPVDNVKVGIEYLTYLSSRFKQPEHILLAYNQGPGRAREMLAGRLEWTHEAEAYPKAVMRARSRLMAQKRAAI